MASSSDGKTSPEADLEDESWRDELREIMSCEHRKCHMCQGFYGSNHSQPICTTCHMFLFSKPNLDDEDFYADRWYSRSFVNRPKDESEDSGTEEPESPLDFLDLGENQLEEAASHSGLKVACCQQVTVSPEQLKQRVRDLTEYSTDADPKTLDGIVHALPPEVLLVIFRHLSDVALYSASNVCSRWAELVDSDITEEQWEQHVRSRWPLFKPFFIVDSWREIHAQLVASSPCLYCIENMVLHCTPPIQENSWRHRRLASELRNLRCDPPEGIHATPLDKKCSHWQAIITGPRGSPYEGGMFYLYLQIPSSYPLHPPFVQFITKIFHPNVSRHGDIGLDSIHHNWSLALTISKILLSIQSLLTDPYLNVCMEPSIAKCYQKDKRMFNQVARMWTWKYAMTERQQVYFGHVGKSDGFFPITSNSV